MTITHPDGSQIKLVASDSGIAIRAGQQRQSLGGEDLLTLSLESVRPIDWQIGDSITIYGELYRLNRLPQMVKHASNYYSYEVELEGRQYDLARVYYDTALTSVDAVKSLEGGALTGKLRRHAQLLVDNALRIYPNAWELGEVPDTEVQTLTYTLGASDGNCLAVLQRLAEAFRCEFRLSDSAGKTRIDFVPRGQGDRLPHTFGMGHSLGLYQLTRQHLDSSNIVTRLRVYGSEDNLGRGYRASRLCLPGKQYAESYIEDAEALRRYGLWEAVKQFDAIMPSRTGVVSALGAKPWIFADSTMFDLKERLPDGTHRYLPTDGSATVSFTTGALAGYEFEVSDYQHTSHSLSIKQRHIEGVGLIPSETHSAFRIHPGDEYKLINIGLPPQWTDEAEARLEAEALAYYAQNSSPRAKYSLRLSEAYLMAQYGQGAVPNLFRVGDYLHVRDQEVGIDKAIRISALSRDVLHPFAYNITLSDTVQVSFIQRIIAEQNAQSEHIEEVKQAGIKYSERLFSQASETMQGLMAGMGERYGGVINPIAVKTMQLLAGDERLQFVFVEGESDRRAKPLNVEWQAGAKSVRIALPSWLMHYTLPESRTLAPRATEALPVWSLPEYQSPALSEADKPYYLYAIASKSERTGYFATSTEPREDSATDYALLVGMLSSEDAEGERSFAPLHGFSEILPGRITTDRIVSADGSTYFDLQRGEIGGNIKFKGGKDPEAFVRETIAEDYLHKVIKDGTTTINGGLVLTNVIGALDAGQRVRSYISGDLERPAFASGLDDSGDNPKAYIDHKGNAKFGNAYIDGATGQYSFASESGGANYMHIGGRLTPLPQLLSDTYSGARFNVARSIYQGQGYGGESYTEDLSTIRVQHDGSTIEVSLVATLTSAYMGDSPHMSDRELAPNPSYMVQIHMFGPSGFHVFWKDCTLSSGNVDTISVPISAKVHGAPAGEYTLSISGLLPDPQRNSASCQVVGSMNVSITRDIKEIALAQDGMAVYYGKDRHLYAQRDGEPFLTIRGATFLNGYPLGTAGMLVCGDVAKSGNGYRILWQAGIKTVTSIEASGSELIIRHNIGHTQYMITATNNLNPDIVRMVHRDSNYCRIVFRYGGGGGYGATLPQAFEFVINGKIV